MQYGGQESTPILGRGTLLLRTVVGNQPRDIRIPGACLVKHARRTLLSAHQLMRQTGLTLVATGSTAALHRDNAVAIPLTVQGDLCVVTGHLVPVPSTAALAASISSPNSDGILWHARLGHPSARCQAKLAARGLIPNQPGPQHIAHCPDCAAGKAKAIPRERLRNDHKRLKPGDVLHADVAFPLGMGKTVVLTVIDEASRHAWVFPLAKKSQVPAVLRHLIQHERARGYAMHTIKTDHGGEFSSAEFAEWLKEHGIHHAFSPPYTPKSNGLIERLHGTLTPRLRAVIHGRYIVAGAVPELLVGLTYLYNRMPNSAIADQLPHDIYHGNPLVSLAHLRVLGSRCYRVIPSERKLAPRSKAGILVGYVSDGRGGTAVYRIFDLASRQVVEAVDVYFDERISDMSQPSGAPLSSVIRDNDVGGRTQAGPFVDVQPVPAPLPAPLLDPLQPVPTPLPPSPPVPAAGSGGEIQQQLEQFDPPASQSDDNAPTCEEPRRSSRRNIGVPPTDWWEAKQAGFAGMAQVVDVDEALSSEAADKWIAACQDELKSMRDKGVYELTDKPPGTKAVQSRWVFALKLRDDGQIERYKARLVAKGFLQRYGVDYTEVWAPTGNTSTLRLLFAIAAARDYDIHQADISTAFLNGDLDDTIYMQQPPKFDDGTLRVWRLRKAIYGLKQGARAWHLKMRDFFGTIAYQPLKADPAVFVHDDRDKIIYTHVDDLLFFAPAGQAQHEVDRVLSHFPGKSFGEARSVLGLRIERDRHQGTISISQPQLIDRALARFSQAGSARRKCPIPEGTSISSATSFSPVDADTAAEYRSMVGTFLFIATITRPDLSYAASSLARYMAAPTIELYNLAIRVVQYLRGTAHLKLVFGARRAKKDKMSEQELEVVAYGDADFANCIDTRRSITGFIITVDGAPCSWATRKQPVVTKSTTAAEYVAASETTSEVVHISKVMEDLGIECRPVTIVCDNAAAVALTHNPIENKRSKYLDVHWHFVREKCLSGDVNVIWASSKNQLADGFTKAFNGPKLAEFRRQLGIC